MLVSIIMPVYNGEAFIEYSIGSVLSQSYSDWELIVIDDCSNDSTAALVDQMSRTDSRVKLVRNACNEGVAKARNRGLEVAQGEYVSFLDCDDSWDAHKLTRQFEFMRDSGVDLSYTCYRRLGGDVRRDRLIHPPATATFSTLLYGNYIGLSTAMLKREVSQAVQFEDVKHEDYLYWLRLLSDKTLSAQLVPSSGEALTYYRVHGSSLSANKWRAATWQWRIYRESLQISRVQSSYLYIFYLINAVKKRV